MTYLFRQQLATAVQERAERQCLLERHVQTEGQLTQQAQQLIAAADAATGDVACLHDTVDRRKYYSFYKIMS